jgi:hypothetical protein
VREPFGVLKGFGASTPPTPDDGHTPHLLPQTPTDTRPATATPPSPCCREPAPPSPLPPQPYPWRGSPLRDRLAFLLLRQPTHEPTHTRPLYPTRRHLAQPIITTRQPTTTQQPRKTTRHQPTTLQHHKTLPRTKHTVQRHTKLPQQPRQQALLVIRPIRDHYLRRRIPTQHRLQHHTRPARVRHIRRRDPYPKHTALRAHHKMSLAPFHFLAPVIPACPPFAVDGTL